MCGRSGRRISCLPVEHSFLRKIHAFFWNRFYINALYYKFFAYPTITLSKRLYKRLEFGGIDKFNYYVAIFFRRISKAAHERFELGGIDTLNYLVANVTTSFCQHFRKTHSGVLSYNMLAVSVGIVFLIVLIFIFGGFIP
jgi:NADH:ubiquinone oxidoreductase subunit 5 (subunit L)/multisubunit Na+/H+ antiporter MnhA subunit